MPAQELNKIANELRAEVLRMVFSAGAGHVAGPLSSAEIITALYFGGLTKFDPNNPNWEERDRVILSCGHYCPVLYGALAKAGYFPVEELATFMKTGSRLPGHPERGLTPGIEASAGPLGQGVSVAVGQAIAIKMKYGERPQASTPRVYCILSDGEIQEGQVWEAFNLAVRRQLDNLIFILDRNKIQIENYISQVATYGDVVGRMEAFGLHTLEVDGNDLTQVIKRIKQAKEVQGAPVMIVANTTAGKGVSYMENDPMWHDKVPSREKFEEALEELNAK